jgi:hypothetical protein
MFNPEEPVIILLWLFLILCCISALILYEAYKFFFERIGDEFYERSFNDDGSINFEMTALGKRYLLLLAVPTATLIFGELICVLSLGLIYL